jgi:5'-nucleotidase/UDP-sugar diphosphatase
MSRNTICSIFAAVGTASLLASGALAQSYNQADTGRVGFQPAATRLSPVFSPTGPNNGLRDVEFYLTVLHNNDGESQLINAGSGLEDFGGVARFKTLADLLKAEALTYPPSDKEHGWVMISSGDNFLAGPEFNASLVNGVPFYDTIALELIGYDAFAIGNHEFDFGPDVLEDFIVGFTVPSPFLSANLDFSAEPGLQNLVDIGRIAKSTVVTVGSQQIGIVGATTPNLPFISSPRDVVVDDDVLGAIQTEVDDLTAMGVDIIIVTSHLQGLNEEYELVANLRDVDLVIGGGGGELIANPDDLLVPGDEAWPTELGGTGYPRSNLDADGVSVPIVTTSGDYRYIGRLIVGFDADGNLISIDDESGPVRVSGIGDDAVVADPTVQTMVVDPVQAAVEDLANNIIGFSEVGLNGVRGDIRTRETNLGNLCADSLLWQARSLAGDFGVPLADVAIQNGGGIRNDSIIPAGDLSELDTFDVLPFSNFVTLIEGIPADQFKEVLENAVSRVSPSPSGRFAQIAGFRFTWDPAGQAQELDDDGMVVVPGTRVREVILNNGAVIVYNGEVVPGAPSVNIATIDFLARGGDQYPYRGAPFTPLGVSYQQALRDYIQLQLIGMVTGQWYPEGGEGRIIELD